MEIDMRYGILGPVYYKSKLNAPMNWYGGKYNLAKWIINHFPEHKVYIEPYGGMCNVLFQKYPSHTEIYNDLNSTIVNFFRVLKDKAQFEEFIHQVNLTPYSREEFEAALEPTDDPVLSAIRFFTIGRQSFSGIAAAGVADKSKWTALGIHKYLSAVECLPKVVARLKNVCLENRPATDVLQQYDSKVTLAYVDPPYVLSTRYGKHYKYELDDTQHIELLEVLKKLQGKVILSGYPNEIYTKHLSGWKYAERKVNATQNGIAGQVRTEVLYYNF